MLADWLGRCDFLSVDRASATCGRGRECRSGYADDRHGRSSIMSICWTIRTAPARGVVAKQGKPRIRMVDPASRVVKGAVISGARDLTARPCSTTKTTGIPIRPYISGRFALLHLVASTAPNGQLPHRGGAQRRTVMAPAATHGRKNKALGGVRRPAQARFGLSVRRRAPSLASAGDVDAPPPPRLKKQVGIKPSAASVRRAVVRRLQTAVGSDSKLSVGYTLQHLFDGASDFGSYEAASGGCRRPRTTPARLV